MSVNCDLDLPSLLVPVSDAAPAGADLTTSEIYDQINRFRVTDDTESVCGTLKATEVRTANWGKVFELCREAIASKSKDLQLTAFLAESLAKQRGIEGIYDALCLTEGLLKTFWPSLYPQMPGDDMEPRAICLGRLDLYLAQSLVESDLAGGQEGTALRLCEWRSYQIALQNSTRAKHDQKPKITAQAKEIKEKLDKVVAATPRALFKTALDGIVRCIEKSEEIRSLTEQVFRQEPGFSKLEDSIPSMYKLRTVLQECRIVIEDCLEHKPVVPSETAVTDSASNDAQGGSALTPAIAFGEPQSREAAIRQLMAIAQYFKRTEPHSPVALLVQRAARWGEMSLETWLEEVVRDATVLTKIRETLGITVKDK